MTFQINRLKQYKIAIQSHKKLQGKDLQQAVKSSTDKKQVTKKNINTQNMHLKNDQQKISTPQDQIIGLKDILPDTQKGLRFLAAQSEQPTPSTSSYNLGDSSSSKPLPALTATSQTKIKISRRDPENPDKKIVFDRDPIWLDKAHSDLIALSSRKGLFRGSILLNYYLTKDHNWPILNLTRGSELFNQNSAPRRESQKYIRKYIIRDKLSKEFNELSNNTEALENRITAIREHGTQIRLRLKPSQIAESLQDFIKETKFSKSSHLGVEERNGARIINYKTLFIKNVTVDNEGKLKIESFKPSDSIHNSRTYISEKSVPQNLIEDINSPAFIPKVALGPGYHDYVRHANDLTKKDSRLIETFENEVADLKVERTSLLSKLEPLEAVAKRTNACMKIIAILGTTATLVNIGIGSRLDGYDHQLNPDGTSDPTHSDYALGRRTWGNIGGLIGGVTGSYFAVKTQTGKSLAGWGMNKHVFEANQINPERLSTRAAMSLPQNIIYGNPFAFTGRLIGISLYDWKERGYKSSLSSEDKEILVRDMSYAWLDYSLGAIGSGWVGAKAGSQTGYLIGKKAAGEKGGLLGATIGGVVGSIAGTFFGPQAIHKNVTGPALDWIFKKSDISKNYDPEEMGRKRIALYKKLDLEKL